MKLETKASSMPAQWLFIVYFLAGESLARIFFIYFRKFLYVILPPFITIF